MLNANGTVSNAITFRAWDGTDGRINAATGVNINQAGDGATAFSAGSAKSAYSLATDTVAVAIPPVKGVQDCIILRSAG